MERREDQKAGEIIIVPAHFLFAEETRDLLRSVLSACVGARLRCRKSYGENIVQECAGIEEDGFGFEEEFCEEREILSIQL